MATRYPLQLVGVADGTEVPALKADGRQVGANLRSYLYSKVPGTTWAVNDVIVLGRKPAGEKIVDIQVNTDTSFGTSTFDIGISGDVDKYCDGKTNTVTHANVSIGPRAETLDDTPGDEEDIIMTILTTDVHADTLASWRIITSTC